MVISQRTIPIQVSRMFKNVYNLSSFCSQPEKLRRSTRQEEKLGDENKSVSVWWLLHLDLYRAKGQS